MSIIIISLTALYGLLIGSALNAIVWRLHEEKSWFRGRSMCPDCKHELAARDLVPVLSWLLLGGRCRYCKTKIHWQYPAVESLTAALFGLSYIALAPAGTLGWFLFIVWLVALTLMILLAVYDLRWMLLPFRVSFPLIAVGLVFIATWIRVGYPVKVWLGPIEAALVAGISFQALSMIRVKNSTLMGGGDVFLVISMGLLLGIQRTLLALVLAFSVAAILSVLLIILKLRKRKDLIPFGPFLIGGTIVAYLYGGPIIRWYLVLNGLQI